MEEDRFVRRARPASDFKVAGSGNPAATDGASAPLILGDKREAPRFGQSFGKAASRE